MMRVLISGQHLGIIGQERNSGPEFGQGLTHREEMSMSMGNRQQHQHQHQHQHQRQHERSSTDQTWHSFLGYETRYDDGLLAETRCMREFLTWRIHEQDLLH